MKINGNLKYKEKKLSLCLTAWNNAGLCDKYKFKGLVWKKKPANIKARDLYVGVKRQGQNIF